MIVDQNGKIIANVVKPTVLFTSVSDYNTWKNNLKNGLTENDFVIIKQYNETTTEAKVRKAESTSSDPANVWKSSERRYGDLYMLTTYHEQGMTGQKIYDSTKLFAYTASGFKEFKYN